MKSAWIGMSITLIAIIAAVILFTPAPASAQPATAPLGWAPLLASSPAPESSSDPLSLAPTQTTSNTHTTAFLPLVARRLPVEPRCSPDSPFSMSIAALHQVVPAEGAGASLRPMTEAEWLALYEEAFPTLLRALEDSGACWARVRVGWAWIQPDPPPSGYIWGPYHDEKLRLVAETGVRLIGHVDGVPAWAGGSTYGPIYPDRLDDFARFLTDLVNHYKGPPYNIHHWELFNEPDLTVPPGGAEAWGLHGDLYAQMLSLAYPAIKAADPEATVLMGGVAHDRFTEYGLSNPFYRYFPDEMLAAGGGAYIDVLNFHYFPDYGDEWDRWDPNSEDRIYGWIPAPTCGDLFDGEGEEYETWGIDLIAKTTHFRNRMATCYQVEKPIWVTELGEHGYAVAPDDPDDPDKWLKQQARYVIQGYARGLAAGVAHITWYALVAPPYDPHEQGLLFEDDWSPKPGFYAYKTLAAELEGYRYAYTLDAANMEGYVFRNAQGQEKTVVWWAAHWPPYGALTMAPASRLRVVDRLGRVTWVEDGGAGDLDGEQNGSIDVRMTVDPVFVEP